MLRKSTRKSITERYNEELQAYYQKSPDNKISISGSHNAINKMWHLADGNMSMLLALLQAGANPNLGMIEQSTWYTTPCVKYFYQPDEKTLSVLAFIYHGANPFNRCTIDFYQNIKDDRHINGIMCLGEREYCVRQFYTLMCSIYVNGFVMPPKDIRKKILRYLLIYNAYLYKWR